VGKNKRPVSSVQPPAGKVPRQGVNVDVYSQPFRWDTTDCDLHGPFGWGVTDPVMLLTDIIPKLQKLETQTWDEVERQSQNHSHFVDNSKLSSEARKRLETIKDFLEERGMNGADSLFSLRLEAKRRVWGVRQGAVLQILWYDPEHQVYPTVPRSDRAKENGKKRRNQQSTSK
jgi:hypothetical protein